MYTEDIIVQNRSPMDSQRKKEHYIPCVKDSMRVTSECKSKSRNVTRPGTRNLWGDRE